MPSRVIDFDALWSSDKLAELPEAMRLDYLWCYGIADANGSFEINFRTIWSKVCALRPELTPDRLKQTFAEFERRGLLFTWVVNAKTYGHWVGSDRPGRLPKPSERFHYRQIPQRVPKDQLAAFEARFSLSCQCRPQSSDNADDSVDDTSATMQTTMSRTGLGIGLGIGVGPGNSLGVGEGPGEGERFEQKSVTEAVSKPVTTENQTPLASEDEEPTPESELESENEHPLDRYHRLKRTLSPEAFVRFERQFQNDYPNMWAQVNGSDEDCPECGGRLYDWINHKCPAPTNRSLS